MKTFLLATLPAFALFAAAAGGAPAIAATPAATGLEAVPLIPREALFGNPTRAQGRLSPDGKWVSWIAPRDGVLNIWVAPADAPDKARPLTAETERPIRQHFWSPDSSLVMFINDRGGDEDFLLYGVAPTGGEVRNFTPFPKTTVRLAGTSNTVTDRILVAVNNRDPRWHDVHSLNLRTGELTLVQQNDGYTAFIADEGLMLRVAIRPNAEGGQDYFRIENGAISDTPFLSHGLDDSQTTSPFGFSADGRTLYWVDARERDTAALFAMDWATGEMRLLHEDARADVQNALLNPRSRMVEAVAVSYKKPEWTVLDKGVAEDIAFLNRELGQWSLGSRTLADDRWVVATANSNTPSATFLYDRKERRLTKFFDSRPELVDAPLATMQPLEIRTRDGKTMVSYLTLPPSAGERPAEPMPMVMFVHGGPWARDSYGYDPYAQFLANRGYAVLQVNFRGSTGFGKGFVNAADGEWGGKMHDDLVDAVNWAVRERIADPKRVAIMGGSYGGYATLAGLTFTPETFACGVNIVGVSNLFTLLSTIPPYWESFRQQLFRRVGNPETPEGQAFLKERSPLTHVERIRRPLLIGHGANDPRVKQDESDQIVDAMRKRNIPVTYVLFPDEGHGFARPANNIAFMAVAENFLSQCIGGRAEPIGGTVAASTAQVPHGAQYAPGLKEALTLREAQPTAAR
jgi:dipeptidyl aminopeptidase/acylaminoacyl peptidase